MMIYYVQTLSVDEVTGMTTVQIYIIILLHHRLFFVYLWKFYIYKENSRIFVARLPYTAGYI